MGSSNKKDALFSFPPAFSTNTGFASYSILGFANITINKAHYPGLLRIDHVAGRWMDRQLVPSHIPSFKSQMNHSMLKRVIPSLVSTIPWNPIRFPLGIAITRLLMAVPFPPPAADWVFPGVPPLPFSLGAPLPDLAPVFILTFVVVSPPTLLGLDPHGARSLCKGDWIMGEFCTLIPGLTARRLILTGSKSSSRRRLLFIRRVISAAVGGPGADGIPPPAVIAPLPLPLP